jgi:ATP/ADP translocase
LSVLEFIVGDLKDFGEALKRLVGECKSQCEVSVEAVWGMIPERLHAYLSLSEDEEHVIVNVRRLNAEQFKAVVAVVIGRLGGEYVSLGSTGYFRIPKKRV